MQLTDVCYVILMITAYTLDAEAVEERTKKTQLSTSDRIINKREATIFIDSYPSEPHPIFEKPKVIYRRISQPQRFIPPLIHKYGPPKPRSKPHKPPKSRKSGKKYRSHKQKHLSSKFLPEYNSKQFRDTKPRYGPPFNSKRKPELGDKAILPRHKYPAPENTGFGEPPTNYANDYQSPKQTYGEPPVDSYGIPLSNNELLTPQNFQESKHRYLRESQKQEYLPWENENDTSFASSKKRPTFANLEPNKPLATSTYLDYNNDLKEIHQTNTKNKNYLKRKPQYSSDKSKKMIGLWINKRPSVDEDVIVGGKYAEPPARYVPKFQPSAPMFKEDEDTFLPLRDITNQEFGSSESNSPYVNYKNSNLAFSPQNLNDAFSIMDK